VLTDDPDDEGREADVVGAIERFGLPGGEHAAGLIAHDAISYYQLLSVTISYHPLSRPPPATIRPQQLPHLPVRKGASPHIEKWPLRVEIQDEEDDVIKAQLQHGQRQEEVEKVLRVVEQVGERVALHPPLVLVGLFCSS